MKKILLIVISTFLATVVAAQNNSIDSLRKLIATQKEDTNKVKSLNELSLALTYERNFITAQPPAIQALDLSTRLEYDDGKGRSHQIIGVTFEMQGEAVQARKHYDSAIKYFTKTNNQNQIADVYGSIASSYNGEQNPVEALSYAYRSLKIYEKTANREGIAGSYIFLGGNNIQSGDYESAIQNLTKALDAFSSAKDASTLGVVNSMLASAKYEQGKYAEALHLDSLALKLYDQVGEVYNKGGVLSNIANIYEKEGDEFANKTLNDSAERKYKSAVEGYKNAAALYEQLDVLNFLNLLYVDLGRTLIKLGNREEAKLYLDKCRQYLVSLRSPETDNMNQWFEDFYLALSQLDSANGNSKQAYTNYKMHVAYRDKNNAEERAKKLKQLTLQYDFDKKESLAKIEMERKENAARRSRNQLYAGIAAVLILSGFLFWHSLQQRQAKVKIGKAYAELKATQAQLIQREKMASLGELTAGIAHEIQNPLNFVNNFAETNIELAEELQTELKAANYEEALLISNDIKENSGRINLHGKRADSIVKSMMEHSRTSKSSQEQVDISAMVDEYLRLTYHAFRARDPGFHVKLENQPNAQLNARTLVPHEIGRVLLNLFNNALYSVNEKRQQQSGDYEPTVSVSTKTVNGTTEIIVTDNGLGIPEPALAKIFQPFFTTKPTGQGTGLGLSLSYDIVRAHGGEIRVTSTEGEGATFVVSLPSKP